MPKFSFPLDRKTVRKIVRGESRAPSEAVVNATMRRQGILEVKSSAKQRFRSGGKVSEDVALFTRQLATMMKSGVPLLQTFDIVGRGHDNPQVGKPLLDIKSDVEQAAPITGLQKVSASTSINFIAIWSRLANKPGFWKRCWIVGDLQGEDASHQVEDQVGIVLSCGGHRGGVHYYCGNHVLRHSCIQTGFTSFGADLPAPTLLVMIAISDHFVAYWWAIFGSIGLTSLRVFLFLKRSETVQFTVDRLLLRLPPVWPPSFENRNGTMDQDFGNHVRGRVPWSVLDSVGPGNIVIQNWHQANSRGSGYRNKPDLLDGKTPAFPRTWSFRWSLLAKSPALDSMLAKVADFFEAEVDDASRSALQPDGTDNHGRTGNAYWWHGHCNVPADLRAGAVV